MTKTSAPIKRSKALIQYSREHHFGLLLVWKIREGLKNSVDPKRMYNYIIYLMEHELNAHFKEEEKELFVKLPQDDPLRIQAFEEHFRIYQLVEKLEKDNLNEWLIKEFVNALEAHIRFEERILFNHIETFLTEEEKVTMESSHRISETNLDEKWDDWFWVNKQHEQ